MHHYNIDTKKKPTDVEKLTTTFVMNGKIESAREIVKFLQGFSDSDNLKEYLAAFAKIADAPLRIIVEDITALTGDQLEALRCGDQVIKRDNSGDHCYTVSFKGATGRCLTYCDCENVETVAYEKTGDTWAYDSTDVTHIAG